MKYVFFLIFMTGAPFSDAEEPGPKASVKDSSPAADEDEIVSDPAGKPYFPFNI